MHTNRFLLGKFHALGRSRKDRREEVNNPDEVICPNCVHQFRAIPENMQILQACAEQREEDARIAENGECDQTEYRCQTVERIAKAIRGAE